MPEHFKDMDAYRRYKAYLHINHIPHNKDVDYVIIAGKRHKIQHPHNEGYCRHCGQVH